MRAGIKGGTKMRVWGERVSKDEGVIYETGNARLG